MNSEENLLNYTLRKALLLRCRLTAIARVYNVLVLTSFLPKNQEF
jgi:hypothetical protein